VSFKVILQTARKYRGLKEVPGKGDNQVIVGWLYRFARNVKEAWIRRKGDEIAWCAVFVSKVLDECGYRGTDNALAASYLRWGKKSLPVPGCVVIIRRRGKSGPDKATGSSRGFHVGFLEEYGKHFIKITGGNQRNRISTVAYSKANYEVLDFRKPEEL